MTGMSSTIGLNAGFAGITKTVSHTLFSVTSLDSKLYGFRLSIVNLAPSPRRGLAVTCRFGGGGGGGNRFSGDSRRGRQKDTEEDDALDISAIRSPTVRLIDEKQNMLGLVSKDEAVRMAEDAELDLVILSPDANPPVVKMMDYSKYRYEQQKKKKDQQKKTSRMDLKELKMGYNIDQHDYTVRLKAAQKFLQDGHKVKVIVSMKGRENEFRNNAIQLLRRFQTEVGELANEDCKNFRDRNLFIVLVPNKEMIRKPQEPSSRKKKKPAENGISVAESAAEITASPEISVAESAAEITASPEISIAESAAEITASPDIYIAESAAEITASPEISVAESAAEITASPEISVAESAAEITASPDISIAESAAEITASPDISVAESVAESAAESAAEITASP